MQVIPSLSLLYSTTLLCLSGTEVIKHLSCSTQLSMKFQLLLKAKKFEKLIFVLLKCQHILVFMSWIYFVLC